MAWYAVEALEDAIEGTREFLFPFDVSTWLRLAIVVFFLGGFGTSSPLQGGTQFSTGSNRPVPSPPSNVSIPVDILTLFVVLFVIAVSIAVVFLLVGSVMEFVLIESLRTQEVHVRRYVGDYFGRGLRLFGFRLVLFLVVFVPVVGIVLSAVPVFSTGSPTIAFGTLLLFIPVIFVLGLFVTLVDGLTTNFVVPVMVAREHSEQTGWPDSWLRERGVVAGWRAFWPTLRREWKQYGVYLVLKVFLAIAVGFLVTIAAGVLSVLLLIPFAILGLLVVVAFGGFAVVGTTLANPAALALFGLLALAYVVCLLFALAVVRVPIRTYLGYFSLFVLGDTEATFDLIPALREQIREADSALEFRIELPTDGVVPHGSGIPREMDERRVFHRQPRAFAVAGNGDGALGLWKSVRPNAVGSLADADHLEMFGREFGDDETVRRQVRVVFSEGVSVLACEVRGTHRVVVGVESRAGYRRRALAAFGGDDGEGTGFDR
jgi:hypothetical protein